MPSPPSGGVRSECLQAPAAVGVSVLCPGWVRTKILDADRNWPADLGERPARVGRQRAEPGAKRRRRAPGRPPSRRKRRAFPLDE
jgi:NAD(P)-dependent dehydrogenase (short-subunit alcohol dehydrogenase family)